MAINYEFLNKRMTDPALAEGIRSKEIGVNDDGGGVPSGPYGPRQPEPDLPYGPFNPDDLPKPEAVMPPAVPEIARQPGLGPSSEPGSPAGPFIDSPLPAERAPAPLEITSPDHMALLTGANNPRNHIADPEPPGGRGIGGFLKRAAPRMLTAALAAGATPSRYGGGILDALQGMQVGQRELERRDLMAYNTARQREAQDLNRRNIESEIGHRNAQGDLIKAQIENYKAQAGQKAAVDPEKDLYNRWSQETDPERKVALWNLYMQQKHGTKAQPNLIRIPKVGLYDTVKGEFIERDKGEDMRRRDKEMQEASGVAPELWAYRKKGIFATHPGMEDYILYGPDYKPQHAAADRNPTEASIAREWAMETDPEKKKALKQALDAMNTSKGTDPILALARQQAMEIQQARVFQDIDDKKVRGLADADKWEEQAQRLLKPKNAITGELLPEDAPERQVIRQQARRMRQAVYDAYTSSIRRATKDPHSAIDYEVQENGAVIPRGSAPPPPGGGGPAPASSGPPLRLPNSASQFRSSNFNLPPSPRSSFLFGPGVPKAQNAPAHAKIMPMSELAQFAKENNMTPQDARRLMEREGVVVQ